MNTQTPGNLYDAERFRDRRKKPDWVTKGAAVLSGVAWFVAVIMIGLLDWAKPESADMFTRYVGAPVRSSWNTSLLRTSFWLLIGAFCICTVAMIFNMLRHRRKTDKYRKSIIILGSATMVGIVVFLIMFGGQL